MKRYSLDKKAPGMFENRTGGWVKYEDALREIEAAANRKRPARLTAHNCPERELPVAHLHFDCSAPGVDIDAIHRTTRTPA
jgi:hypothetical protein